MPTRNWSGKVGERKGEFISTRSVQLRQTDNSLRVSFVRVDNVEFFSLFEWKIKPTLYSRYLLLEA